MSDKVVSIVGSLCSVFGLIAALVFGFRAEGYVRSGGAAPRGSVPDARIVPRLCGHVLENGD